MMADRIELIAKAFDSLKSGKFELARQLYEAAVPQTAHELECYAVALMRLDQIEAALEQFHKARELDSVSQSLNFNLAVCYERSGQYSRALRQYGQAWAVGYTERGLFINMGRLQAALGFDKASLETYRAALVFYPDDLDIQNGYALQCYRLGMASEALKLAEGIYDSAELQTKAKRRLTEEGKRRFANALDTVAAIFNHWGEKDRSLKAFRMAEDMEPSIGKRSLLKT
jgi:tetratricopeptide (TPR) repeat protein